MQEKIVIRLTVDEQECPINGRLSSVISEGNIHSSLPFLLIQCDSYDIYEKEIPGINKYIH